jgi:transcriptional regulator
MRISLLPIDILWEEPNIPRDTLREPAVSTSLDLLQGTLDLLVLRTLSWGPAHGYDVARWIQDVTGDVLRVEEGSLYPALHRLEKRKLLKSSWGLSRNNRRAKYYEITAKGREALASEASAWSSFTKAVATVMTSAERPEWAK